MLVKKLFNITKEPVIITNGNKGAILITNDVTIIDGFKVQVKRYYRRRRFSYWRNFSWIIL